MKIPNSVVYIHLQYVRIQKMWLHLQSVVELRTQIDNFNASFLSWKNILLSREEKIRRREETFQNIEENVLQEERMAQVITLFPLI